MNTLYHFNRCSKSRQALQILEDQKISFTIRYYIDDPLSKAELIALQQKLQVPFIEMVRTNEKIYPEVIKNSHPTDEELLTALTLHPQLLQRPIFETADSAVIARPSERVLELI